MIYLIGGVPRSGKSVLAEKLSKKLSVSHIELDLIYNSIKRICGDMVGDIELKNITIGIIKQYEYYSKDVIIEGVNINSYVVEQFKESSNHSIVFIGYPNISISEKLFQIRSNAGQNDWTIKRSDKELSEVIDKYIDQSDDLKKASDRFGISFLDTSVDFMTTIDSYIMKL
jgi:adenylate kinase family enzyme